MHRDLVIALAARQRLPAVYPFRFFVAAGGLLSYSIDFVFAYRQAASYVDRILRGARPADPPVQAPTKFETVLNLQTAKAIDASQRAATMLGLQLDVVNASTEAEVDAAFRMLAAKQIGAVHLAYLPFAALMRRADGQQEYAVQRYAIGYLPSLYFFDLVFQPRAEALKGGFVAFADPRNDLPKARASAIEISKMMHSNRLPFLGSEATMINLRQASSEALYHRCSLDYTQHDNILAVLTNLLFVT